MKTEDSKISTIIAKGTKITGDIDMQGSLRIDGFIKGKVSSSETLTVGSSGVVEGEVIVKEAVVGGKIMGDLKASQRVELENNASILGDVKTRIFVIKEGGIFHGKCSMRDESAEKSTEKQKESIKLDLKATPLSRGPEAEKPQIPIPPPRKP